MYWLNFRDLRVRETQTGNIENNDSELVEESIMP
jgi:hypothetical protein